MHEEPDLSRLPPGLHELVRLCLAKNPGDRPDTALLIEAARDHPATGGELRFADGWLPQPVSNDIHRHSDLPTTPPPRVGGHAPASAAADAPTAHVLPAPAATRLLPAPAPAAPTGRRAAATPRRGARTVLLTTVALLVGAAAAFVLLDPGYLDDLDDQNAAATGGPSPSAAATADSPSPIPTTPAQPTTVPGYTTAYANLELTSPDHQYEFDLTTGKVAAQDTATWYLGRHSGEFYIADDNEAHIAPADGLTLPECLKGIKTQPAATLPFATLRPGRSFCVSSQGGRDVAVVRALTTASDDGPVRVSITAYHRAG
ncbi:hypothetical protein P3T27_005542 [Kitasatospora sp. MAA19]|nr:hypothetical protein [Kitasatospora sp. MAA19]